MNISDFLNVYYVSVAKRSLYPGSPFQAVAKADVPQKGRCNINTVYMFQFNLLFCSFKPPF